MCSKICGTETDDCLYTFNVSPGLQTYLKRDDI
jgi:hypothetical protein